MSCIVYQTNKKTGAKYAYVSESYWDKEKKQPRSRRKYLGRVDPDTGEIIQREKKDQERLKQIDGSEIEELKKVIEEKEKIIQGLQNDLSVLYEKYRKDQEMLSKIQNIMQSFQGK